MPQITIKGVTEKDMLALSTPLIEKLAVAIGCPEDWLIIESVPSKFFAKGMEIKLFPIVEVQWYVRPMEIQSAVVKVLHEEISALGYSPVQIIFKELAEDIFYELD